MRETTWPPGPWTTPGNGNVVAADGTLVVSVPRPKGAGAAQRRAATARFIAEAPALYAACKAFMHWYAEDSTEFNREVAVDLARAALARAAGR